VPIYAFTDQPEIQRKLQLSFGVVPFTCAFPTDPEETVQRALDLLTGGDFLSRGEKVVLVSDTRAHERMVNTVQLRAIG
jgi:pyruvate kinase